MLKFYVIKEDDTHEIVKFETLKEFWNYTGKNYIKQIQTLDEDTTYSFNDPKRGTVQDEVPNFWDTLGKVTN